MSAPPRSAQRRKPAATREVAPTILVLCTGNVCRSPAAALVLKRALGDRATITSAGTHALIGDPIPDPMLDLLAADGLDGTEHRARQVTPELLRQADAVIAVGRDHRTLAVQLEPTVMRRTTTLAELAAAADTGVGLEGDGLRARLAAMAHAVAEHRHWIGTHRLRDVPDPYGRRAGVHRDAYVTITRAVDSLAPWLLD